MKIVLLTIGKTSEKYLVERIFQFQKRLKHYTPFEIVEIPNIKNAKNFSKSELLKKEGELILKQLQNADYLLLLDDRGKRFTSVGFAKKLQNWMLSGKKRLVLWREGLMVFRMKFIKELMNNFLIPNGSPVFCGATLPSLYHFKK
jgi:23S rRNA (pseudouridine1915-N3)-methyltransferase|tara:strand:+ start:284 stop:718 length:435 start_codon:yes stop_codon:yes gene_type:complete